LLIVLDTVRADHLDLFGYKRPTMPNLRRFALEQCQVAQPMITTAPWTVPSHASMFTGLFPSAHGAHFLFLDDRSTLDMAYSVREDVPTLAGFLGEFGYETGLISANSMLARYNLPRGFHEVDAIPSAASLVRRMAWLHRFNVGGWGTPGGLIRRLLPAAGNVPSALFTERQPPYRRAHEIRTRAQRWLDRHRGRPFFLAVNFMEAHAPFVPIAEDDERFAKRPRGAGWLGFPMERYRLALRSPAEFTSQEMDFLRAQYDAELVSLDRELGRFLAYLKSSGILKDTVVLVTTDHGESFLEHGIFGHGFGLYQPEVGGFLLVRMPAQSQPIAPSPHMQFVDFFPTFAALIGRPAPSHVQGSAWGHGRDYSMSEEFCQACRNGENDDAWPQQMKHEVWAVVLDGWKLIRSKGLLQSNRALTDFLRVAPDGKESRASGEPNPPFLERVQQIRADRDRHLLRQSSSRRPDADQLEQLRGLGYID
jgi:arylsulfatase A-like enzyme